MRQHRQQAPRTQTEELFLELWRRGYRRDFEEERAFPGVQGHRAVEAALQEQLVPEVLGPEAQVDGYTRILERGRDFGTRLGNGIGRRHPRTDLLVRGAV